MTLGHEKLDVYRLAIDYVAWVYSNAESLGANNRAARDQWLRASQSIPLNIAEGNGKTSEADRRRYFEIARGSALECAAIQDVLVVCRALDERVSQQRKKTLIEWQPCLAGWAEGAIKLGRNRLTITLESDSDFDPDFDGDIE